jgi:hypothetical protein
MSKIAFFWEIGKCKESKKCHFKKKVLDKTNNFTIFTIYIIILKN